MEARDGRGGEIEIGDFMVPWWCGILASRGTVRFPVSGRSENGRRVSLNVARERTWTSSLEKRLVSSITGCMGTSGASY